MALLRAFGAAFAAAVLLCAVPGQSAPSPQPRLMTVTIETRAGPRVFRVEVARNSAEQERGLMYRTNLPEDGGMIFVPYPPEGGPPRAAQFWMRNTPTALDILFIRADGTIARVAADAEPFSEAHVRSEEPVAAVLEIHAGKAAALGIAAGDRVRWRKARK